MKIALFGISSIPPGKHNIKDPRLDETHRLVEADRKTYAQVDIVDDRYALEADMILTSTEARPDLILKDLELIETRLGRSPVEAEKQALLKIQARLEAETFVTDAGLSAPEAEAVAALRFYTQRPVLVGSEAELAAPEPLLVKAFQSSGYICFLTVGGKENRAWPIRRGATAWEAAASIHSDLQKGFVRAEVIGFDDFIQAGGETQAKRAGKLRLELKTYVVQDYDLITFRSSR